MTVTNTHPSHSQTSRLLNSSLSLGVPVPRVTGDKKTIVSGSKKSEIKLFGPVVDKQVVGETGVSPFFFFLHKNNLRTQVLFFHIERKKMVKTPGSLVT
jgi:hypothetical protein